MTEFLILFVLFFPFIMGIISFLIGIKNEDLRDIVNILMLLINLFVIVYLYRFIKIDIIKLYIPYLMGTGIYLKLDIFRYIFIAVTGLIWLLAEIYSTQYLIRYQHRNRYYLFFIIAYASTIGVFLSNCMISMFTFFEMMSFSCYPLIIHDEDKRAHDASKTYIFVTIFSGLILLMGIFLAYAYTGTFNIDNLGIIFRTLGNEKYVIAILMLIGFGVKAGMFPLHIWLPKAHPAAPTPASAVLSGVIVKTGIFGLIIVSVFIMECDKYISTLLVIAGFINMLFGGFNAIFKTGFKVILAYSTISQLGYMMLGIGCIGLLSNHREIAVYGSLYYIVNHAIFKSLMFMGVGIIYMITHKLDINDIRGFGRFKPILKLTFFIAFCAAISVPGFNGFISKTMLHHSFTESMHSFGVFGYILDILFYVSGAFTTAYLIKLYFALFVENNPKFYSDYKRYINYKTLLPLIVLSLLILTLGVYPSLFLKLTYGLKEAFDLHYEGYFTVSFYTLENIMSSLISIVLGIVIYKYIIDKKLTLRTKSSVIYMDITTGWPNLEEDVYIPLINVIFKYAFIAFHLVDNIIFRLYRKVIKSDKERIAHIQRLQYQTIQSLYNSFYKQNS